MDHPGERVRGGHPVEQGRHRRPVGQIAGGHRHLRTGRRQPGHQFVRTGRGRAAPADQQQPPYAVPGDQVSGDEPAQPAGAAGDQHGAVRVRAGRQLTGGHRQRREPGREQPAGAYRELRLGTGGEGRAQPGRVHAVDVDQDEPARILRLGGPDQTPEGRVHRPGHVLTVAGGDRAGRHQDQPRPAEPVVGEPPLDQVQRPGGSRHRRVRQGPPGQHDGLRRVPGPLDVGRERGQVRVVGHPEAEVRRRRAPPSGRRTRPPRSAPAPSRAGTAPSRGRPAPHRAGRPRAAGPPARRPRRPGAPPASASSKATASGPVRVSRTRSAVGAGGVQRRRRARRTAAWRRPSSGWSPSARPRACSAASSSAGCSPNRAAVGQASVGQRHLGVHLVAALPGGRAGPGTAGRSRSRPRRAGRSSPSRSTGVGAGRRPGGQRRPVRPAGGRRRSQHAGGVPGPRRVGGGRLGREWTVDRAAAGLVGGRRRTTWSSHRRRASGSGQRRLQGQLLHPAAADLVTGADGQLDEGRCRAAAPCRRRRGRRATGGCRRESRPVQHDAVGVGQRDRRAEQRVAGRGAGRAAARRRRVRGRRPASSRLALEGVRRQVDARGRRSGAKQARPVDRHAPGVQGRPGR